ncbi:MAG: anti-sigma factor [Chloroflexota bacterium]
MNCDEIEELAGAYALGALPDDERAAVSAHLETCDKHPEMAGLLATAASLALAVDEVEPPAALKSRLMGIVEAEAPPQRTVPARARRGFGETVRGWFASPRLGYGLASAMAVLVVGLLAWNVSLQGGGSDQQVVNVSGNAAGRVIYLSDEKLAVMDVHNLSPLPEGKVYEVWGFYDSANIASPLGLLQVTTAGTGTGTMAIGDGLNQIAVTIEDAPGAVSPTLPPVLTAKFS